jgi:hypothetical protein
MDLTPALCLPLFYSYALEEVLLQHVDMHPGKTLAPLHSGERHQVSSASRRHLYENARKPVREDQGTPYPCAQQDLDGYVQHHHSNRDARYVTPIAATNELCDWLNHFNEPDAASMAALERLKTGIKMRPWQPDLVIKAFKDLDLAFFKGTLTGNVRVKWMCRQEWLRFRGPEADYLGVTQKEAHAQCRIVLNAETVLLHPGSAPIPFREMWRTMLHEMCVREYPQGTARNLERPNRKT